MSYATSKEIALSEIPVIDMTGLRHGNTDQAIEVASNLRKACEDVGFFYVENHGVSEDIIAAANTAARSFFSSTLEEKQRVAINDSHHGFIQVGEAKMYDGAKIDLKESYVWGDEPAGNDNRFLGPNNWPENMPELRSALMAFFVATTDSARHLMKGFALSLGLEAEAFLRTSDRPISRGSALHYPPQPEGMGEQQFGVAPHSDYGCLTLVWQDEVGGLEVLDRNGDWVTAHPIPGTFVVNVGDLLSRWTNSRFMSTAHRVVNRSPKTRHSLGLFFDPNFETVVDPADICGPNETPRFEATTCGDYILSRLDAAFSYRS
tara:strand:+ start:1786 stop:2742 length:957 start_codon:yes stop_codon:yes gene_type:complete